MRESCPFLFPHHHYWLSCRLWTCKDVIFCACFLDVRRDFIQLSLPELFHQWLRWCLSQSAQDCGVGHPPSIWLPIGLEIRAKWEGTSLPEMSINTKRKEKKKEETKVSSLTVSGGNVYEWVYQFLDISRPRLSLVWRQAWCCWRFRATGIPRLSQGKLWISRKVTKW